MSYFYQMMLFLFILGAGVTLLDEVGLTAIGDTGLSVGAGKETVVTLNEAAQKTGPELGVWQIMMSFAKVIGSGILALFAVSILIFMWGSALGTDPTTLTAICVFIQVPITVVTLAGLWQLYTGREL